MVLRILLLGACATALLLGACTDSREARMEADARQRKALVGTKASEPAHGLSIRFGDFVRLRGYDVSPITLRPGHDLTVRWYWEVLKPLPAEHALFTHMVSADGRRTLNLDGARVIADVYPPAQWKAGEFIRDPQKFTIPQDLRGRHVDFMLGFYGPDGRLPITEGPHDADRRARVRIPLQAPLSVPEPVRSPEAMDVPRRTGDITLDGKLTEADWDNAGRTGLLRNTVRGTEGSFDAKVRVLYDDAALYVAFEVEDPYLISRFTVHDDHLWEQDTVEVMIDPDGDEKNYFEIQVAPTGNVFETAYERWRHPRPFGHVEWTSNAEAGVEVEGEVNDDEEDEGYTVEMRIPVEQLVLNGVQASPPKAGSTYRANFFVMDALQKGQRAVGWSPPLVGDFHKLDRFGILRFR